MKNEVKNEKNNFVFELYFFIKLAINFSDSLDAVPLPIAIIFTLCFLINDFNSFLHKKDKQKFNELKDLFEAEVENIVNEAEVRCFERCEICGSKSDVTSTKGWIKRLCDYHMRKRNDKNE